MTSYAAATRFHLEIVDDLHKSGESTETLQTAEMSESSRVSFDDYKEMVDNFNSTTDQNSEKQHLAGDSSDNHATTDGKNMDYNNISHLAGIWYPESRDCGCCQGFKYGCVCVAANKGVCMCVASVPDDVCVMTTTSHNPYQQQYPLQCYPIEIQRDPLERVDSRRSVTLERAGSKRSVALERAGSRRSVALERAGSRRSVALERAGSRRSMTLQRASSKRSVNKPLNTDAPCRFFTSGMGCRYGDDCPFKHEE